MLVSEVHHVSLNVNDVPAAEAFYVGILGLEILPRPDLGFDGRWLRIGNTEVHLLHSDVPDDKGQHFAFQVADIDTAVQELRGHGIKVSDPSGIGTAKQAFLHDPSGNRLEINQPGANAAG